MFMKTGLILTNHRIWFHTVSISNKRLIILFQLALKHDCNIIVKGKPNIRIHGASETQRIFQKLNGKLAMGSKKQAIIAQNRGKY